MQLQETLTTAPPQKSSGPSLGPRERIIISLTLLSIVVWGFSGSWDFPEVERMTGAGMAPRATPAVVAALGQPSRGAELFEANGCYACHSINGEAKIGPTLLGIVGQPVAFSDGSSTTVDEAYLTESILNPQASLVSGYDDVAMPNYEGLISEDDARALVAYIKSLE